MSNFSEVKSKEILELVLKQMKTAGTNFMDAWVKGGMPRKITGKPYASMNLFHLWAKKADKVSRSSGEAISQIGKVYYKGFQSCRSEIISLDDRIVASLAFEEFDKAEKKGFRRNSGSMQWLKENEVLFGKANWFMLDPESKSKGFIKPSSSCYNWIDDKLIKQPGW